MPITAKGQKKEFQLLFLESQIQQAKLARLLGKSTVTVNRWLSEREDGVEPPYYAIQFMRAYLMLPEAARGRLIEHKSDAAQK